MGLALLHEPGAGRVGEDSGAAGIIRPAAIKVSRRQVMCDFGKWSNSTRRCSSNNWGITIDQEWSPYWIDCAAWTARCYVVTTNNSGTLTPEQRTLPGWSGANQIPLTVASGTGTVTVNFTLGTNMTSVGLSSHG